MVGFCLMSSDDVICVLVPSCDSLLSFVHPSVDETQCFSSRVSVMAKVDKGLFP